MSAATKTLELLSFFSAKRPRIGLSEMCRLAGRDKATTYRHLQSLEEAGFIEQNPVTRQYQLGPIVLQLAQTRETTVPRKASAEAVLKDLADATGETAHVTVLAGSKLYPLASCESPRHSTRAIIDITTFPLHATASGLCALAFGPPDLWTATGELTRFTAHTVTTAKDLAAMVHNTHLTGIGRSDRAFEDEIYSLSTPVFDQTDTFAGAVSVASVASRFTRDLDVIIMRHLIEASRALSRNWGGTPPAALEDAWAQTLSHRLELDTAI